jgi:predicted TIM-barrel fold metal-dependent hydrolase
LLNAPEFRKGLSHLVELDLTFDAWLFQTQIPELVELARAFPRLNIILNHMAGPLGIGPYDGKREEVYQEWLAHMEKLAACDNVCVKLGGRTMTSAGFAWHKRERPPGSVELADAIAPYFNSCIDLFGPERCMFESNFPVDKASCSYTVLWNAFKKASQHFSVTERAALFHDTAVRIYRLDN